MMRCLKMIPALVGLASCTALNQKDTFLDDLSAGRQIIMFADDFENGLGQWSQVSGSWTTGTPAINGAALISPTGTSATPYNLTTINDIDLRGRANCELKYDVRFDLSATSGVAAQILYAGDIVGDFKQTSGTAAMSSASQFLTRKAILTAGINGKLTILIQVPSGTGDLRVDNVSVTCNNAPPTSVTLAYENMGSTANWVLQSAWAASASGGYLGTASIQLPFSAYSGTGVSGGTQNASFQPALGFANRFACQLSYYYSIQANNAANCMLLEINGSNIWTLCNVTQTGNISRYLTAFEGTSANTLQFRCRDSDPGNAVSIGCTIDELKVTCQQ
jgi:hypothetical protein